MIRPRLLRLLRNLALLSVGSVILVGCGAPITGPTTGPVAKPSLTATQNRVSATNPANTPAVSLLQLPTTGAINTAVAVASVTPANPTPSGGGSSPAQATESGPTSVPATAVPLGPTDTPFVVGWLLYGSPTPTPILPTATPTEVGKLVVAWLLYGTPTPTPVPANFVPSATPATQPTAEQAATQSATAQVGATTEATQVAAATTPTKVAATAASGGATTNVEGDPAKGKALFTGLAGCSACHDFQSGIQIVGPSLKGVATRAATRKPPMSAVDYLRESIMTPNAFVVKGFPSGVMPQNFAQQFSPKQINDLIAFLLTLK